MGRLVFVILVSSLLLTSFLQVGNITTVKASSSIFQGDLILTGNNVTVIEGQFDINGSIIVEDNATLILRNSITNFTQTSKEQFNMTFDGNSRMIAENAALTSGEGYSFTVYFYANSSCNADQLEAWPRGPASVHFRLSDSSVLSMTNSRVYIVVASADNVIEAVNSNMRFLFVLGDVSANISLSYITYLDISSSNPVNILTSTIYNLDSMKNSVVLFSDSQIYDMITQEQSTVKLVNSTCNSYSINNESMVYVGWHLDVHVVDDVAQNVLGANVTATYADAISADSKLTDPNGIARLTLMEKMINATGEYPLENYTIEAKYPFYMAETTVIMTENKEITLTLEEEVPLQVTAQLSPETVTQGDNVTISAMVKDEIKNPIEGATVTATIGDLEVLTILSDQGNGEYAVDIDTSSYEEGTYDVVVTARKNGYIESQTSQNLTVNVIPLQVSLQLTPKTVAPGEEVELSVTVRNGNGNPISGAEVTANLPPLAGIIQLEDQENGNYKTTLSTTGHEEGTFEVVVTARKTPGYRSAQAKGNFSVELPIPWHLYGGIAAIAVVAVIVIFYLVKRK